MPMFKRRDPFVEAMRVTADNMAEVAAWCGGVYRPMGYKPDYPLLGNYVEIGRDDDGYQPHAEIGRWVVKEGGKFSVVRPTQFSKMYERVRSAKQDAER